MPCEKIKRITRIEITANFPNNGHKDTIKCYKQDIIIARSYHLLLLLLVVTMVLNREGDLTVR
jgi:hypothetical protein